MFKRLSKKIPFLATFLLITFFTSAALASPQSDIENSLICPACFDDGMTVAACGDSTAEQIKAEIRENLAAGKTKEQIIAGYVSQYGEKILTNPPKKGFNIMAWVMPFTGLFLGGGLIYVGLTKWVKSNHRKKINKFKKTDLLDDYYDAKVEEEIKKYL